jgi:adenylate cyclase
MAYIIHKANRIDLDNTSISIGRGQDNDLIIADTTVSRNHAILKQIGKNYYIIDSGSSNGTFKDGKRVHSPVMLENKSLIQCGNGQIVFYENKLEDNADDEMTMISFDSNIVVKSIIVVADIKGYTSFSESTEIRKVSKFMSQWFSQITACIEEHNGYLDSFIGDCVYARWDMDDKNQDLVSDILQVSKTLNNITVKLSSEIADNSILNLGVGIHIGDVIVGAISNNTGLGDAVNTAFRLESQTRKLDTDILLSEEVYNCLSIEKKLIDVELKGKHNNIKVCSLSYEEL